MPDGRTGYVTRNFSGGNTVVRVDLRGRKILGYPTSVGLLPEGINITPDGAKAHVDPAGACDQPLPTCHHQCNHKPELFLWNFIQPAAARPILPTYQPTSDDVTFFHAIPCRLGRISASTGSNLHGLPFRLTGHALM